eukprot:jgi/Tetstr1/440291/TSEL_028641.t1
MHIIIKGDFDNHRDNIKQLVASTAKPVSLLIADSNYGLNLGPWDVAWTSEFKNTLSLVDHCNDGLQNCKFIWFLTDQALPHAMAAISERDMQFKVFYWSKNRGNCAGDRFTSDGEIFLMCWPPGHQLDIFKDPTEPERYTTNPYCARIPSSNMFRLESTDSIAAGQDDGHATEENEQAEASEDVANPVGEDDDDEEEEEEEEGEEEGGKK